MNKTKESGKKRVCFLCQTECSNLCPHCKLVHYCSQEHFQLHRLEEKNYCYPYETSYKDGIGRILKATRTIKSMDLVLVDPGTVIGPNYCSKPVCLECLQPVDGKVLCQGCLYPMCSDQCLRARQWHSGTECEILGRCKDWPNELKIHNYDDESNAYAVITPLRMLLLQQSQSDPWNRTNQLMDHEEQRRKNSDEWNWYQRHIVDFFQRQLGLDCFTEAQIHRAIGLLNINAVALQFPKSGSLALNKESKACGKGLYPIFAIMSHYCICNARYTINPYTFEMYVRARRVIVAGEEISVQYLSALYGNFKRRKKIVNDWYFDCLCRRCSDPTEGGTNISAIKCSACFVGNVIPINSLKYDTLWRCQGCDRKVDAQEVEELVDQLEEELEDIGRSGDFQRYNDFIDSYQETLLHSNHYLLMTATRNLIQFYTYSLSNEALSPEMLRKKHDLCQKFNAILAKVDPGYSEIRSFVQKELNFSRLLLYQQDLAQGLISRQDYLNKSRQALSALDDVERCKNLIQFSKKVG